ncbi:MAG: histidinol phosphate phosphatase domain-containing protein [Candidatus Firestonebacteria bacterium]
MISLHMHSLLSDGGLIPSELARRAEIKGYRYLGITDHVDDSNIEDIALKTIKVCEEINKFFKIKVIPGVEITHVFPKHIPVLAKEARNMGIKLIIVHGETIVEPVIPGTNLAALNSDIDLLAHPGFITKKEVELAKKKGIMLELTTRPGHSLTNGYVAKIALEAGVNLVLNTDAHSPDDLVTYNFTVKVARGAGLSLHQIKKLFKNSEEFVKEILK